MNDAELAEHLQKCAVEDKERDIKINITKAVLPALEALERDVHNGTREEIQISLDCLKRRLKKFTI